MIKKIAHYKGKGVSLMYHFRWGKMSMIRKITFRRVVNIIHVLCDWKLKRTHVKSRPLVIRLETSAVCNLKCPGCITPTLTFPKGSVKRMDMDSFKEIYGKVARHAYRVTFYIKGEPMTNVNLFKMIQIATRDKAYTSISTNFTLMKEAYLKPLFDSGLDWLSVCLDGFTQEAYGKYRVNGKVDDVKNGIKMVMDYKLKNGLKRPFVNVYSITFNHVKPEMDQIKSFCEEHKVDELRFRPDDSNWDGSFHKTTVKKDYSACFWPYLTMSIDVDGTVYPCNPAMDKGFKYGNLLENSLDEIWNNELYVETRKYLAGKREATADLELPCYNCRNYCRKKQEVE